MAFKRSAAKVGRNDNCPCGSGKKFKKCCLPKAEHVVLTDEQTRYDELVEKGRDRRIHAMREYAQIVMDRSRRRNEWDTAEFDAIKIDVVLDEVGRLAAELLSSSNHSRQYWFQLLRRLAPLLWEEFKALTKNKTNAEWFAEVTKSAGQLILSSSSDGDPWEWVEENGTRGIDYRGLSQNELLVAAQIFSLAQLRYEAQVRYRFACKGFRVFATDSEVDALFSQNTDSIERYEERRSKYDTLSGSAGLWCDTANQSFVRKELCHWVGLRVAKENVWLHSNLPSSEIDLQYLLLPTYERTATSSKPGAVKNELDTAILCCPYDYLIEHPRLRSAFESAFNCEAEQLVAFLYSVFRLIHMFLGFSRLDFRDDQTIGIAWVDEPDWYRENVLHKWADVGTLALLRSNKEDWIDSLLMASALVHDMDSSVPALNRDQLEELFSKFTWKAGMPCYSDRPLLFSELSSHTAVLDGFSAGDFLRHVLLAANLVSKDEANPTRGGDVTGQWLELQASAFFIRELGLAAEKVIQGSVVRKAREIDIAFVFNRILFVIDCKAMAKDAAYMEGQHKRLRNRRSEIHKELTVKIPQRIDLIEKGHVRGIIDPGSFDQSFGLVCTSTVEYLPLEDTNLWSDDLPLAGPPNELLNSIRTLSQRQ